MAPLAILGRILAGLVVGFLVGLTGIGGGILLLPIFTSVLGIPPLVAVGSDAVVNSITKVGAGIVHWRRGNVNWRLIRSLIMGSIPGALVGVFVLTLLHASHGARINEYLKITIAVLLIVIPLISLYARPAALPDSAEGSRKHAIGISLIGLFVGLLVGITSIGSGTVTLMLLLVLYGFSPVVLVGTDVIHALLLTGVTGLLQMRLGNVDYSLVGLILAGSVPGGILGAYISNHVPAKRLKQILFVVLIVFGVRMLWGGIVHGT